MPISLWDGFIPSGYSVVSNVSSHNPLTSDPGSDGLLVATLLERPTEQAYVGYVMLSDTEG